MTERLTAPARSPLRRNGGKDSPVRTKQSKSPIRRSDAKTKLRSNANMDIQPPATTEADCLREHWQAEAADVEHATSHLSPALQRFWQRSKAGELSPRSMRLSHILPKPKGVFGATQARLSHARGQLADMKEYTRAVQATAGSFLKRHFELIPQSQLSTAIQDRFHAFDISGDGTLCKQELKDAFASMGRIMTDAELDELMLAFDEDKSYSIDVDEFEALVRVCLNIPLSEPPNRTAHPIDAADTVG